LCDCVIVLIIHDDSVSSRDDLIVARVPIPFSSGQLAESWRKKVRTPAWSPVLVSPRYAYRDTGSLVLADREAFRRHVHSGETLAEIGRGYNVSHSNNSRLKARCQSKLTSKIGWRRKSRPRLIPCGFVALSQRRTWRDIITLPLCGIFSACGVLPANGDASAVADKSARSPTPRPPTPALHLKSSATPNSGGAIFRDSIQHAIGPAIASRPRDRSARPWR